MSKIEEILGKDINSLKELREEIKRLQDEMAGLDTESQQFKDDTEKLSAAQDQLAAVTRKNKQENEAAKDSIVGMEQEYRKLYNTYKMLTEEQRNSAMGKQMAQDLNQLSEKLNDTKKGVGNFKDNIGRYTTSIIDAFKQMGGSLGSLAGPLKSATTGMNGLNAAMKANPVGAVIGLIMALVNALRSLSGAIKGNEELQMKWNEAMAAFQPIADGMKRALDAVGQGLVTVVGWIADFVRWLGVAAGAVTDFFGITKGAKERAQQLNQTYKDIAKTENELVIKKREYQKLDAKDKAEVERLREQASETENLSEKQRLLTEAKEKQAEIDNRAVEVAKDELDILQKKADLTPNSTEDNNKLAAAEARVAEAEAQAAANARLFNKQIKGAKSAAASARKEFENLYKSLNKEYHPLDALTEEYKKNYKAFKQYGIDTTLLQRKFNDDYSNELIKIAKRTATFNNEYKAALKSLFNTSSQGWDDILNTLEKRLTQIEGESYKINTLFDGMQTGWKEWTVADDFKEHFGIAFEMLKEYVREFNDAGLEIDFPPEINLDEGATAENLEIIKKWFSIVESKVKEKSGEFAKDFVEYYDIMVREMKGVLPKDIAELNRNLTKEFLNSDTTFQDYTVKKIQQEAELLNKERDAILSLIVNLQVQSFPIPQEKMDALWAKLQEIMEKIGAVRQSLIEYEKELNDQLRQTSFDAFDSMAASIQTVTNAYQSLIQTQLQEGKLSKKEADKKIKTYKNLEKVALAVNIAQIAASTAGGIMEVWKGYAAERASNAIAGAAAGVGAPAAIAALNAKSLATAIINTTALATQGIAQIAAAKMGSISKMSSFNQSSAGGSDVTPTVTEIASSPYTYTRNIQNESDNDVVNQPIWVSVQDIESALDRQVNVKNETHF